MCVSSLETILMNIVGQLYQLQNEKPQKTISTLFGELSEHPRWTSVKLPPSEAPDINPAQRQSTNSIYQF